MFVSSNLPKNEPNFVRISALASKMGQTNKMKAHIMTWHNKVPLSYWLDPFYRLRQKSSQNLVHFLGDLKTPKFPSEINWPLVQGASAYRLKSKKKAFKIQIWKFSNEFGEDRFKRVALNPGEL